MLTLVLIIRNFDELILELKDCQKCDLEFTYRKSV